MGFSKSVPAMAAVAVVLFRLVAAPLAAGAQEAAAPRVQIPSFMAPTTNADGGRGTTPMTIVLQVDSDEDVTKLCLMLPRIRDAVMQDLYAGPPRRRASGELDMDGIAQRITGAANTSLGTELIRNTEVFEGMRSEGGDAEFAGWRSCRDVNK